MEGEHPPFGDNQISNIPVDRRSDNQAIEAQPNRNEVPTRNNEEPVEQLQSQPSLEATGHISTDCVENLAANNAESMKQKGDCVDATKTVTQPECKTLKGDPVVQKPLVIPFDEMGLICRFLSPIDIINIIIADGRYENICCHKLRMRRLRLNSVDIRRSYVKYPTPDDKLTLTMSIKTSGKNVIRKSHCELFDTAADYPLGCNNNGVSTPVSVLFSVVEDEYTIPYAYAATVRKSSMIHFHSNESDAFKELSAVLYYLLMCYDVSSTKLNLSHDVKTDVNAFFTHFGSEKYNADERFSIGTLSVSSDMVRLLHYVTPHTIYFSGYYQDLFHNNDELLVDEVQCLSLDSGHKCEGWELMLQPIPELKLWCGPEELGKWTEERFHPVLTALAKSTARPRKIEVHFTGIRFIQNPKTHFEKLFLDWKASVGPDVYERNGEARITMEISRLRVRQEKRRLELLPDAWFGAYHWRSVIFKLH